MRKKNAGDVDPEVLIPLGIFFLIVSAVVGIIMIALAGTSIGPSSGYIGKLFLVIHYNLGFWIMLIIATGFGVYRKLTNPEEFTLLELPIQLAVSTVSLILLFSLFFSTTGKLADTEIWNGYVTGAEYHEEWTERVEREVSNGTDSKGNSKGSHTEVSYEYHSPEWKELTTVGDITTNKDLYRTLARYFGNERKKTIYHTNQSSFGDGNMYYATYDSNRCGIIPAARPHFFVNYLKASDSVKKIHGSQALYKDLIRPYPEVYYGTYGEIELDRVINAGVTLPEKWKKDVNQTLSRALTSLGSRKEVNVLVYVANTKDQGFSYALEEAWVKGKNNDVIIVIGAPEFPKVSFAYVMAWTKIEEFKINLRNKILDIGDLSDGEAFANTILEDISKSPKQGGFERMPMADLEYLIADIRLPWWCQLLIILVGGGVSYVTSVILINNEERN